MAIDMWECSNCNDEFCRHCETPNTCFICKRDICDDCEERSISSDYTDRFICKECFKAANEETKKSWLETRYRVKMVESVTKKVETQKVGLKKNSVKLSGLESLRKLREG
jgi:hypothetical protein